MFRPSLTELEHRENPALPFLDPAGVPLPPPTDTVVMPAPPLPPLAVPPTTTITNGAYVIVVSIVNSVDPFLADNTLTGQPLIQ